MRVPDFGVGAINRAPIDSCCLRSLCRVLQGQMLQKAPFLALLAMSLFGSGCVNTAAIKAFQLSSTRTIPVVAEAASRAAQYDGYQDAVFVAGDREAVIAQSMRRYRSEISTAVSREGEVASFDSSQLGAQLPQVRADALRGLEAKLSPEWRAKCLSQIDQLLTRGWIVCKVGHAVGNVNFGSFTLPAAVFTWGWVGNRSSWLYVHTDRRDFNILGTGTTPVGAAAPAATPVVTPRPATPPGGESVEQKLLTLKRLRDAGALTEEEYQARRAKLLQQLE